MEVILLERIEKLGQMGDVVNVKPGFARNFLLPQAKALRANKANMAVFEARRSELEAMNLTRRQEAEGVAEKMTGIRLILVRQASESGHLYGSVAARDIQESLKEEGYKIERSQINLPQLIKALGSYVVPVALHPEVSIDVAVTVARSLAEAEEVHTADEFLENAEDADEAEAELVEAEDDLEEYEGQ